MDSSPRPCKPRVVHAPLTGTQEGTVPIGTSRRVSPGRCVIYYRCASCSCAVCVSSDDHVSPLWGSRGGSRADTRHESGRERDRVSPPQYNV
eukprot:176715-Prymnesium_polylepis.1